MGVGEQGVRTMSSAAKSVKAPAQTFGISGRYASALWQHANTVGALEKVRCLCDWCKTCLQRAGGHRNVGLQVKWVGEAVFFLRDLKLRVRQLEWASTALFK